MIGPVGIGMLALSLAPVIATRRAPDRAASAFAWYVGATAVVSLVIHVTVREPAGRASPLMLMDAFGLYAMGLVAVCRTGRPLWLYALTLATAGECAAHIAYVAELIGGNTHTLLLNLLFIAQVASLFVARSAVPEDDLGTPLLEDAAA